MQHLIRNNSPYTVIILFIFALIIKMQALAAPQLPAMPPGHLLYASVLQVLDMILAGNAFAYTMLSVIMLFLQALYINSLSYKYKLFAKPTYIVAFLYLVFTSLSREFNYFGVMLLLNWCLIGALDILLGFHHAAQPRKHIFNGGFVLSLAAILHFPAVGYLVMLFFAFSLLRSFNVGEWVVGMLGFITPLYFFAGILFLYDALPELRHWPQIGLSFQKISSTLYMTGTVAGMSMLTLAGLIKLQGHLNKVSVFMRRNWVLIMISLVISIFVAASTPVTLRSEWLTVMLPLSLIVAHAVYIEKNKAFSNFVFYFSLALLIFCQITF